MPNTRLKKLLDKKKNAAMMPKHILADYEEEYLELLSRIESERKKLGIDDESISNLKKYIERQHGCARKLVSKELLKRIVIEEQAIDRAARNGDLDDLEYHKSILISWWKTACIEVNTGKQVSLF